MAKRTAMAPRGGPRPHLREPRAYEWTAAKKKAFIAELAATCSVLASLRAVGMDSGSLYKLRKRDAKFRAEWAEALREGYAKLEMMLLERAMNGTVRTVTRGNGSVDKTHEYPNAIALALLRLHKDSAGEAAVAAEEAVDADELRERIGRRIERLRERMQREQGPGATGGE